MGRRLAAGLAAALLASLALAAGVASAGPPAIGPVGPPVVDALTIDTLSPGALVFRVGIVGSYWQADSPANVSVYADGRAVLLDPDAEFGYSTFVLGPETLAELLDLAADATPFDEVDYGEVMVTDVGSTRVEVHADQGDAVVTVWALDHDSGLNDEQRANRGRLLALVAAVEGLADATGSHAEPLTPFVSAELMVRLRPVLLGMDADGTPEPWPLAVPPTDLSGDSGFHSVCFAVAAGVATGLPDGDAGEHLWSLPADLGVVTPSVVAASITAVLPGEKPCEAFDPVETSRPLTATELAAPPHDWASPWAQGVRTTTHPFEEWMAVDAMARTVLPAELGGTWDWSRWSWFDYRFAASEIDSRRVIDFQATCTEFVNDEEPACTIDARFDATTAELLEFSAT